MVSGIGGPIPFNQPLNQPQRSDNKPDPTGIGVSFQSLLGLGKKRPDGTLVVAEGNKPGVADFNKSKLEIEQAKPSQTEREKAMAKELLDRIYRALPKGNK